MIQPKRDKNILGVIVVHYGNQATIYQLLEKLAKQNIVDYKIYVVDNDPSLRLDKKIIAKISSRIHLIVLEHNIGWAGGCNSGAKQAIKDKCQIITFLTADTIILQPDYLMNLTSHILQDNNNIALPVVVYESNHDVIWMAGAHFNKYLLSYGPNHSGEHLSKIEEWVIPSYGGIGLTLSVDAFKKVGGWSREYFLYYEDIEICQRLILLGYTLILETNSTIGHRTSSSKQKGNYNLSGLSAYCYGRAGYIYISKNMKGFWRILPFINLLLFQSVLFSLSMVLVHHNYLAIKRYFQGVRDGLDILLFNGRIDNSEKNLGKYR